MLKSPTINIFQSLLHPHIFFFTAKVLVFAHYLLFLKSHSSSNPLQSGFCLYCFSEIAFVKVADLLVFSAGGDFSVLLLFQSAGIFGLIFSLGFGDANSPVFLPTSSSLLLRPLCQFPFFCLFLKLLFLSVWFGTFSSHSVYLFLDQSELLRPSEKVTLCYSMICNSKVSTYF